MNNELPNKPPFKVKCIDNDVAHLTIGKEYNAVEADSHFYRVTNDSGKLQYYVQWRFEIVETPIKDKQEFSVGDKVMVNFISDDFVTRQDKSVKVGDVATVVRVINGKGYNTKLSNPNWEHGWWFSRNDISLVVDDNPLDNNLLTHQEAIQAIVDGKELEIQYTDGTWHSFSTHSTTLHQFINLNFRLKPSPSLEDKRKAVIKKLLETKVAVLCKCWDDDDSNSSIMAITCIDEDFVHPYLTDNSGYKNAIAIDDNGNEITNV